MSMTLDDAMYGLRNIAVGDDEDTRIADMIDDIEPTTLRVSVQALVDDGAYADAYAAAIWPILAPLTRDAVISAIAEWVSEWDTASDEVDDDRAALRDDMVATYDSLARVR